MPLACVVPISTAVVEPHPAGVTGGECREGVWVIDLEALPQDHGARLSWPRETFLHWGPRDTIEVQELSALGWPLRYGVTTAPGWYADERGRRHAWVPGLKGLCLKRQVSQVTRRAGGCWSMLAGIGCRRAAWLLDVLFQVVVSQAASAR